MGCQPHRIGDCFHFVRDVPGLAITCTLWLGGAYIWSWRPQYRRYDRSRANCLEGGLHLLLAGTLHLAVLFQRLKHGDENGWVVISARVAQRLEPLGSELCLPGRDISGSKTPGCTSPH